MYFLYHIKVILSLVLSFDIKTNIISYYIDDYQDIIYFIGPRHCTLSSGSMYSPTQVRPVGSLCDREFIFIYLFYPTLKI